MKLLQTLNCRVAHSFVPSTAQTGFMRLKMESLAAETVDTTILRDQICLVFCRARCYMPYIKFAKTLSTAVVVATLCANPTAFAQESADSVVTIAKEEGVKISNINDWDFGSWAVHEISDRAVRLQDNTCVYSSTGSYSLTLSSQNGSNRLRLRSADGERIRYNVVVRYRDGNVLARQLINRTGTTINNMTGSLTLGCTGARNWNLRFIPIVNKRQFNRASPGIYQDVVTLLVTPE